MAGIPHPADMEMEVIVAQDRGIPTSPETPTSKGKQHLTGVKHKPLTMRRLKKRMRRFIRSMPWTIFMIIIILYILFVDDIVAMAKAERYNGVEEGIGASKMVVLAIFILEFVVQVFSNWKDFNAKSLFFWLDLLAIGSMIPDVILLAYGSAVDAPISMFAISRAGRAARASGRVARILRVSQFYSCYGFNKQQKRQKEDDILEVEPSKLGLHVINTTTNKVVVIVLLLTFAATLFHEAPDYTTYVSSTVNQLVHMYLYGSLAQFDSATQDYLATQGNIIFLRVFNQTVKEDAYLMKGIFGTSIYIYEVPGGEVWLDMRDREKVASAFNFALLVLVIVLLTVGNLLIIRDTNKMVITPIEKVLVILKQLSPDGAASLFKKEHKRDSDTDDGTTSRGDDDDDEADAIFDMLDDIDESLQAAKEKAEFESGENKRLRNRVQDLIAEKKILELQVASLKRGAPDLQDIIAEVLKKTRVLATMSSAVPKLNFALDIGGRKFASFMESDQADIKFHPVVTAAELRLSSSGASAMNTETSEYPQVKMASIDRLVERLAYEEYTDMKYINTFLLTYRALLPPLQLMERLFVRYCITPALGMTNSSSQEHVESWKRQKQEPIRIGVCNVMKHWVGKYYWDFQDNEALVTMLNDFVFNLLTSTNMERHAAHMEMLLKKKQDEHKQDIKVSYAPLPAAIVWSPEELALPTAVWSSYGESELTAYEATDLAAQITLHEHELFKMIRPSELLGQVWIKKNKEIDAPNVLRLIDHFNNLSSWLKSQIVRPSKPKHRAVLLKLAITLGTEFLKLNNYNGAMEVLAALSNAAVSRLKASWELLPASFKESFAELGNMMSSQSSYKLYRESLHSSNPPSIPYIGVYLSDLVFIDEGNPDYLDGNLVNFDKLKQVAAVIHEVQKYQTTKYTIPKQDEIQSFIGGMRGMDDDTLYKISLLTEPRVRTASMSLSGSGLSPSTSSFLQRLRSSSTLSNSS